MPSAFSNTPHDVLYGQETRTLHSMRTGLIIVGKGVTCDVDYSINLPCDSDWNTRDSALVC
jgi:hypothetical protein